jgi:small-conductance mechanosensitive channel
MKSLILFFEYIYTVTEIPAVKYSLALGCIFLVYFFLQGTKKISIRFFQKISSRTSTSIDDLLVELSERTYRFVFLLISLTLTATLFGVSVYWEAIIFKLLSLALAIQITTWATIIFDKVLIYQLGKSAKQNIQSAIGIISIGGKFIIWLLFALLVLSNLGYNISALLAGLGVGGVAVALAVQTILSDLLASLSIILDRPFDVGDFIVVNDIMGTVEYVGIKTTRLRSLSGEQLIVSNADLISSRIKNYKRMNERRVVMTLTVPYETENSKLKKIPSLLKSTIESTPCTRFDRAHLADFADSSINFELVFFILDPDYNTHMDVKQECALKIIDEFEKEGIEFAYKTQSIYLQRTRSKN